MACPAIVHPSRPMLQQLYAFIFLCCCCCAIAAQALPQPCWSPGSRYAGAPARKHRCSRSCTGCKERQQQQQLATAATAGKGCTSCIAWSIGRGHLLKGLLCPAHKSRHLLCDARRQAVNV